METGARIPLVNQIPKHYEIDMVPKLDPALLAILDQIDEEFDSLREELKQLDKSIFVLQRKMWKHIKAASELVRSLDP